MASDRSLWSRVVHFDAHHRLTIAGIVGVVAFFVVPGHLSWLFRIIIGWDSYVIAVLILAWITIVHADPAEAAQTAKLQDSGRTAIFAFVLVAACASVFAIGALLGTAKGLHHARLTEHIILAVVTLLSSWTLVHTVFTMRYAHVFYDLDDQNKRGGGLVFPDEENPDYLDFAYFSFVVGMTCQTSDVGVSGRRLRHLTLVHGMITFGFNTAIVAGSVNLISGLFS